MAFVEKLQIFAVNWNIIEIARYFKFLKLIWQIWAQIFKSLQIFISTSAQNVFFWFFSQYRIYCKGIKKYLDFDESTQRGSIVSSKPNLKVQNTEKIIFFNVQWIKSNISLDVGNILGFLSMKVNDGRSLTHLGLSYKR